MLKFIDGILLARIILALSVSALFYVAYYYAKKGQLFRLNFHLYHWTFKIAVFLPVLYLILHYAIDYPDILISKEWHSLEELNVLALQRSSLIKIFFFASILLFCGSVFVGVRKKIKCYFPDSLLQ